MVFYDLDILFTHTSERGREERNRGKKKANGE